jgi:hypothetical protein
LEVPQQSPPDIEVAKVFVDDQWQLSFRRLLNEDLREDWVQLHEMLNEVSLTEGTDVVLWALEKSRKYSTRSLYKLMTDGGVIDTQIMVIRKCNIPLKVPIDR